MTLIATVKELRELEKSDARELYYLNQLLKAVPDLLDVLGGFREGDADRLLDFMEYTGENCESPEEYAYLEMLKRLHGMAAKMEEEKR